MKLKTIAFIASATLVSSAALAQTEVPNTFESGQPANAADVNANFTALATAIDNLATRVTTLESASGDSALTLEDLVGNTYCIAFFGNLAGIGETNFARFGSYIGSGKLTISSTVLASVTLDLDRETELGWYVGGADGVTFLESSLGNWDWINGPVPEGDDPSGAGPIPVDVNSLSGSVLSVTFGGQGGDLENFNISPDGSMLMSANFSSDASEAETNLILGMQCE